MGVGPCATWLISNAPRRAQGVGGGGRSPQEDREDDWPRGEIAGGRGGIRPYYVS